MFETMILGLGEVRLLSVEDEGDCYFDDSQGDVMPPDFRLVTTAGDELLIEVKNVAPKDVRRGHSMRLRDVDAHRRYAELTHARLLFAHYWSGVNLWTLVDASRLSVAGTRVRLKLEEAIPMNELGSLGDRHIGTKPPLVLSLYPSDDEPAQIEPEAGAARFRVGRVGIKAGGRPSDLP